MAKQPLPLGALGNIHATKQPSGRWRARAHARRKNGTYTRINANGLTKAAAERDVKRKWAEENTFDGTEEITPDTTVADLGAFWLSAIQSDDEHPLEESTVAEYRRLIEGPITTHLGGLRLREVTASRLERMMQALPTASRRKKVRTVLGRMLDLAVVHDCMVSNPIGSVKKARYSPPPVEEVTLDEIKAVRARMAEMATAKRPGPKFDSLMPDVIDMLLATGCRIGEVLAIRWSEDVDFSGSTVTVAITGTIKWKKGVGVYRKPTPKTKAGVRRIELPPFAASMLRRRRAAHNEKVLSTPGFNSVDAVFPTRNGTWNQVANIENKWERIREGTDFEHIHLHQFRKTVATLVDHHHDADTAARLLGHTDKKITEQHYINRAPETVKVAAVIEEFLAPDAAGESA